MEAANTATNSAGSGYRENAEYLKSYEAQINMVKNAWTESIISMQNSGLGDAMLLGLKAGLEFFNGLTATIDKVGVLPLVLGGATVALLLFNDGARKTAVSFKEYITSLLMTPGAARSAVASIFTVNGALKTTDATAKATSATLKSLGTFLSTSFLPVAGFMLLGAIISKTTQAVTEHIKAQKELRETVESSIDKGIEAVSTNKEQVEKLITSYKFLSKEKESGEWNVENEEKYLSVQQELSELFPTLIQYVDEKGRAHLKSSEEIDNEVASMENLLNLKRQEALENAKDTYQDRIKPLQKYQAEVERIEKELANKREYQANFDWSAWGHNEEEGKRILELSRSQIRQLEIELTYAQGMLANSSQNMTQEIRGMFETFLSMIGREIAPQIKNEIGNLFNEINWSGRAKDEIEEIQKTLSNFALEMDAALKSGNVDRYNQTVSATMTYLQKELDLTSEEIEGLVKSYSEMSDTIANDEALRKLAAEAENAEEAVDGASGSIEEWDEKLKKLVSSVSYINGVLEDYQENNRLSTQTIMELIDKYPELITYINDEAELIKQLEKIRDNDRDAAKKQLADKLSNSEEFYKNNLKLIEQFVKEQYKFYQGDLTQWKSLAEAKLEVEKELINTLAKQWGVYYDKLASSFVNPDFFSTTDFKEQGHSFVLPGAAQSTEEMNRLLQANEELKKFRDSWNDFTLDQVAIDFDKIGTSLDKNTKSTKEKTKAERDAAKAMEQSTFIADKYKRALEELNLELKIQQDIQSQFPDYSSKHVEALQAEIKLQQEKDKLLESQEKNLQAQIKAGNILKTGVVTSKSEKNLSLSGWGGSITSQYGKRNTGIPGASTNHQGIDIAGKRGTRIDANVAGVVTFAGNKGNGLGNYVAIKDASGNTSIYGHLEKVLVKAGQSIAEGMAIGNMGSSGTASGSHLHYQVNDASGKSINPASYVDAARKGISNVSKEIAQTQADIDAAKSELIGVQSQRVDEQAKLRELEARLVRTTLSPFENRRKQSQQIIDYEIAKLGEVSVESDRYGKTLDKVSTHLKSKQRVNYEEITALEKLIRTGGLTGETLAQMKDRVWELKTEMFGLNEEIQEISAGKIDIAMKKFDDGIEDISYSLERSKLIQSLYEEGSSEYSIEAKKQIEITKEHQQAIVNKRNELQRLILTENIGTEKAKEYGRQIQQLSLEYWQLANSVKNAEKAMADNLANTLIDNLKSVISARKDAHMKQLESEIESENQRHELAMANIDREMDSERERHKELQDYYDYQIEMEEKSHKKKMDNLKKQLREFERYIQSQIEGIDRVENTRTYEKDIEKLQKEKNEIQRMLNELAGDESYEADAKRKELNKRLEEVDDQLFERRNSREIELRKENYDDLLEKEQLRVEQVEENETKLHEQKLEDIKDLKKREDDLHDSNMKNLENRKKAEDATHKARVNNINDLKKYWTQFYDDQLNNEREFARIREEIVKGNLDALGEEFQKYMDEMIATMPELENTMNGTMQAVGTAVRQNLIDNLREALRLMNEFNAKSNTSRPVSSPSAGSGGSSGGSSSSSRLSSGDLNVLTGKFLNDKLAPSEDNANRKATIKDKGHSLADAGRASGSTISSTQGFDAVVGGLSKEEKNQLGQYLMSNATGHVSSDYLKDQIRDYANRLISSSARFDTGGFTGKFSGGKLATLDPEELILDKKDTKTFAKTMDILDRVFNMINPLKIPSITPPSLAQGTGQGNIEINFNVDKMTGDKNDVNKFTQQVARTLKRERGIR
ncbi:peptidoglycan DD-metalloendopeptidase family protein [Lederbergia citrisecunda]|uniref:peptidoglycan DD-metalloendopeptidase family protein n=1 Tax=Lederbergia citrisecunda TaxID=2833583 RepID=UPI003D2B1854